MAKIKAALEGVARALKIQHALRAKAVRRMDARHKEQAKAERQAKAAREKALELRQEAARCLTYGPHEDVPRGTRLLRKAERKERKAERLDAKAKAAEHKAIAFKRVAKRKTQQIHKLRVRGDQLEADLKHWEKTHGPHVGKGGGVAGADSKGEGFIWVNKRIATECATGKRPTFYSMEGSGFNVTHALLKREQPHTGQMPGERSDCSLYGTECCLAAGLPDPNGEHFKAGYTGTALGQHNDWRIVSEAEMRKRGWGIVIYLRWPGDTVGHHWEDYVGEGGDETIGHGSAPIDPGVINLFGNGLYACLIYD
jgi:hypothetical protein